MDLLLSTMTNLMTIFIFYARFFCKFMKTENEIAEYRKEIEQRLVSAESMDAMKYYQGVLRALEWVVTGNDV